MAYLINALEEIHNQGVASFHFPDQPIQIQLSIGRQGELLWQMGDPQPRRVALPLATTTRVLATEAARFFDLIGSHIPSQREWAYQSETALRLLAGQ